MAIKTTGAADDYVTGYAGGEILLFPGLLLANDDIDFSSIQDYRFHDEKNGRVYWNGSQVVFEPTEGYTGDAGFRYTLVDHRGVAHTATVNINVLPPVVNVNHDPIANDDYIDVATAGVVKIKPETLLANDSDSDGDQLSGVSIQHAEHGTVYWDGEHVVFTPDAAYTGPASFLYTITDDQGGYDTATVTLNIVTDVIDEPEPIETQANDDDIIGYAGARVIIAPHELLANDKAFDGGELRGVALGDAVNGTVTWTGSEVIFTPNAGYAGPASFTYTVADSAGVESTATVNLTIVEPMAAPDLLVDDTLKVGVDGQLTIDPYQLYTNDALVPFGKEVIHYEAGDAEHGALEYSTSTNRYIFMPDAGYVGQASFTYSVITADGTSDTAVVNIEVIGDTAGAPIAYNDYYYSSIRIGEDGTYKILVSSLLENDRNDSSTYYDYWSNPAATFSLASVQNAVNGSVTWDGGDTIVVTPTDYFGSPAVSFDYTITNAFGESTATVNIKFTPNTAPLAVDDGYGEHGFNLSDFKTFLNTETPLMISAETLLANDRDLDVSDVLSVQGVGQAAHGTVSLINNQIAYMPDRGYVGIDKFEYTIVDAYGETSTAEVTVYVSQPEIVGTNDDDILVGTNVSELFDGLDGDDLIDGLGSDDRLYGSNGHDQLYGGDGDDFIDGGRDNDQLDGGAGSDYITGGYGNDQIKGGAGSDSLLGDFGADTFVWTLSDLTDEVATDFVSFGGVGSEQSTLDIADLLVGEDRNNIEALDRYLNFEHITETSESNPFPKDYTKISISSEGLFDGNNDAEKTDQIIKIELRSGTNEDLTLHNTLSDVDVLKNLLSETSDIKLIVD